LLQTRDWIPRARRQADAVNAAVQISPEPAAAGKPRNSASALSMLFLWVKGSADDSAEIETGQT
jgi:hypothetical protein